MKHILLISILILVVMAGYGYTQMQGRMMGSEAPQQAGGYSPLCYSSDVTEEMVDNYRSKHGLAIPVQ